MTEQLSNNLIKKIFQLQEFYQTDHSGVLKYIETEIFQIIETITTINAEFKKNRAESKNIKIFFKNSSNYISEGMTNKTKLRRSMNQFGKKIRDFKKSKKEKIFISRKKITKIFFFEFSTSSSKHRKSKTSKTPKKKRSKKFDSGIELSLNNSIKNRKKDLLFFFEGEIEWSLNKFLKNLKTNALFFFARKKPHSILKELRSVSKELFLKQFTEESKNLEKSKNKSKALSYKQFTKKSNISETSKTIRSKIEEISILEKFSKIILSTSKSTNISDKANKNSASKFSNIQNNSNKDQMFEQMNRNILTTIKTIVEKTLNSRNNTSHQEFSDSSKSTNSSNSQNNENANNEKIKGNSKNIEFFDFNYDDKFMTTEKSMTHIEKKIYYKNVHIFVKKMKEMTIIFDANVIKRNLSTCLKRTTLIGHIVELIETSKRILTYENNVNEGILVLIARFKQQTITIITALFKKLYNMKNARKLRELKKYVQKIVRLIKSAQMKSVFNQLNIIYNDIDAFLKKDLKRFTNMHTFDEYLQKMNDCKKIGWKLTKTGKIQNAYSQKYREKYQNNQIVFYRSNSKGNQTSIYQQFGNKYINSSGQFQRNRPFQNYSAYRQPNSSQETSRRSLSKSRQIMSSSSVSTSKYLTFENFTNKPNNVNKSEKNSTPNLANSNWNQGRDQRFNTYNNQRFSQFRYQNNQNQNNRFGKNRNQKIYFENEDENNSKSFKNDYDDDMYYDNIFYEKIMKNSKIEKSNNVQNFEFEEFEKINVHIAISEFFLTCKCCGMIFYFNNKLHKHLRIVCKSRPSTYFEKIIKRDISIIEFTRKPQNNKKYGFRFHQYATIKIVFTSIENLNDVCMNFETFMSLIDKMFFARKLSNIKIHITISSIKIRDIEKKLHDNFKYCYLNFYIFEKIMSEFVIEHIKNEMHFVNDLKTNLLIKTNIMMSKKIFLNFHKKTFIIFIGNQMSAPIKTNRKKKTVNRTIRILKKTVIPSKKLKTIEMKIKEIKLFDDRDFNFHSIVNIKFGSKNEFFAHVINSDVKIIQIRNISNKFYVLSKNLKVGHVKNYNEKECYMMFSKKNIGQLYSKIQ